MNEIKLTSIKKASFNKMVDKQHEGIFLPSYTKMGYFMVAATPQQLINWKRNAYKVFGKEGSLKKESDTIYWKIIDNEKFDELWQISNPWE